MYGGNAASSSCGPASKLLVVVSDGRGIMNEGKARVLEAVRATRAADVFVVFVIVEAEDSAQSILDIRVPIFDSANALRVCDTNSGCVRPSVRPSDRLSVRPTVRPSVRPLVSPFAHSREK